MSLPTWDETIVPALRKRLETESRILAKRMSIASVSSTERSPPPSHSRHLPEPRKSSAIPRPSLQSSRTDLPSRVNGSPSIPKRARTYSQPPSPNAFTDNPLPTPASSRPTSPRTSDVKPTRIPIAARTRTTSASSHAQRPDCRNGSNHRPYLPPTPDASQDHRVVKPSDPPQPTTLSIVSIRHQPSSIINEPPPFPTPSLTSSIRSRTQDPLHLDPRPSYESEERPFEHWYRGDVHRNGGVGELRVAKHVEMLQIANYGHTLRNNPRRQSRDSTPQIDSIRQRRRADSVDAGTHESLYLDDTPTKDVDLVLDETPLTDIDPDPDTEPESFYDAYAGVDADDTILSAPGIPHPTVSPSRSQTPTNACPLPDDNPTPKHATFPHATSFRSNTPSSPPRTSADSTMPTPGPGTRTTSSTPQSLDHSQTKRRAKSPAAPSTPKKAKTKAKTPPSASRREDPRNSIATYPTPEGDVVHAIPTWTQPVQKSRNWDEVVLPVVARKKGLDNQYEQADGSPKPRSHESSPIKPAPGTFGFDYTKYRPPRHKEEMELNEFGRIPEDDLLPEEDSVLPRAETPPRLISPSVRLEEPIQQDPRQTVPKPPDSPAPFSRYHTDHQVPTINVTRPSSEFVEHRQEQQYEDDVTGGCCKCIIM